MNKNETILITGVTDGIGLETANRLAKNDINLLIHGRDRKRTEDTVQGIKSSTDNDNVYGFTADYSHLYEVSDMSKEICNKFQHIDILINNAGLYSGDLIITNDGFELTYQVNYLAPFLLTLNLLDKIKKSKMKNIINVASMAHASSINMQEIKNGGKSFGYDAYSLSKLCNILFTKKLAAIMRPEGVNVNCLHPGVINTKILREGWGPFGSDVKQGADNLLHLVETMDSSDISGSYFMDKKPASPSQVAFDENIQDELWKISLEQIKNFL